MQIIFRKCPSRIKTFFQSYAKAAKPNISPQTFVKCRAFCIFHTTWNLIRILDPLFKNVRNFANANDGCKYNWWLHITLIYSYTIIHWQILIFPNESKPKKWLCFDFISTSGCYFIWNRDVRISKEKAFKNLLVSHIEKLFSSFSEAYGKLYSTQHVLIRIIEGWKNHGIV